MTFATTVGQTLNLRHTMGIACGVAPVYLR